MVRKLFFSILLLVLIACGGKYGTLQLDDQVGQGFVKGELKPNFTYYYFGRADAPTVIMGLDKRFVLGNPDMWYPIQPQTSENLRVLVKTTSDALRMQMQTPPDLRGFRMLDQNGRYVGDWYSLMGAYSEIQSTGNSVIIFPPEF